MANRPQTLTTPAPRQYSRTEFAALRAWVQGIPVATVARQYLDAGALADLADPADAALADPERFLRTMRDDLVRLAILHGSPVLAEHLKASIARHGHARLGAASLRLVEQAARLAVAVPAPAHAVGLWFRPLVAQRLTGANIATLADLVGWINVRGPAWWRALPRIGPGRARALVAWLRRHEGSLGLAVDADVREDAPPELAVAVNERIELAPAGQGDSPTRRLVPLERMALPHALSGERGSNRAALFPYVRARHDLDAVRAYLAGFSGQDATQRAYRRELERLLLWAVAERGVALSSLTVEDCEAYKRFLAAPSAAFTGAPVSRASGRWRPFAPGGLSPASQRYAVRALRAAFDWLVNVRYLAGNPWRAVRDPVAVKRAAPMRVERALPLDLWTRVRHELGARAGDAGDEAEPQAARWRAARALLLLMGDAGLRVAEAAAATREALTWLPADGEVPATWWLGVVGKGRKERFVPLSDTCVAALGAHWRDRGLVFAAEDAVGPLVAPLVVPPTPRARAKFGLGAEAGMEPDAAGQGGQGKQRGRSGSNSGGYSVRGARALMRWATEQLLDQLPDLSETERRQLHGTSPHALRHTFGTQAVAADMPLDVVQRVLGHASLQTTSTYVTAEQRRVRAEAAKYHARLARPAH